jgi:peptide/nickel transport system substrate-binding protein/oligopeptide transport system substrate-binding protein
MTAASSRASWALLLGLVACCLGCCKSQPVTFRYHLPAEITVIDPARFTTHYTGGVINRVFDGLMTLDRLRNLPVPELAESYTISENRLVYRFYIHPQARFHHGRKVLASDVKYSWERLLDPELMSEGAWLLYPIEGAARFHAGEASSVTGITVEAPDCISVRLERPTASFLHHLTNAVTAIVPYEYADNRAEFERHPVGCGPFRFISQEPGQVILEAFTEHYRHSAQVQRLIYLSETDLEVAVRRYHAGEIDLISRIPVGSLLSLQQGYAEDLHIFAGTSWYGFCLDCEQSPFNDRSIRRALALAIDREALVRDLGDQFVPQSGFIPTTVPGYRPQRLSDSYDPGLARELLEAAGYPNGVGFPVIVYTTTAGRRQEVVFSWLKRSLAELGIELEVQVKSFQEVIQGSKVGGYSMFRLGWGGEFPTADVYLWPLFHSQGRSNRTGYCNPDVDLLLDAAAREPKQQERSALFAQAEELIIEDAPCVSLYQLNEAILLKPCWKGIPIGLHCASLEIEKARLEKAE